LFDGMQSSGACDGGTTGRVIKTILQDMQFNGDGIFFMFTSNDIDQFPDPLIDRCDVWEFDLPGLEERADIWSIHIKKRNRDPKKYNTTALAKASDGYSGRQIEQVWIKALMMGFNDGRREPTDADVLTALQACVPTSVTMAAVIEERRKRLSGKASPASTRKSESSQVLTRKIG
jgi:SpoVK/Ycf46/Vps4 family AAA+-type ATPase